MDTDNQNNNLGTIHTLTNSDNTETINFVNSDIQQDSLDVSNVISNEANAENINLYLKINTDGVYLDNSGSGKFSVDNQIARFDNSSTMNAMIAVQVSESLATTVDWTATSHIPVEDLSTSLTVNNTIEGSNVADNLQGTSANDALRGSWGNDTLAGQGGADTYIGGAGDDVYVLSDDNEVDKIDFVATGSEKDSLDVSNILPEAATATNISQYIKVTEAGVFLDKTGQGDFTADNLIAEFTTSSVFNAEGINLILRSGESLLLNLSPSSGVQLDDSESYASEAELSSKLDTYQVADSSVFNSGADVGVIRSTAGEKFNLDLQSHNITEAHGGAGNERLDASNVSTNVGDGNLSSTEAVKLYGREGADTLVGSDDSNFLDGGAGNDRIEAGLGRNLLAGGEGEDEFVLTLEDNSAEIKADNLYDFSSQEGHRDVINLEQVLPNEANATNIHSYVKVTDTGVFIDVTGKAHFSDANQLARFGEKASIDNLINVRLANGSLMQMDRDNALKTIQGEDSDDEIQGGAGSDVLYGNAGDDTLDGDSLANSSSADHLYGGEGQDTLKVDNLDLTEGTVDGGAGVDTVHIVADSNTSTAIDMNASNIEKVWGAESSDMIDGSGYTDTSGGYNKYTGEYETTEGQRLELYGRGGDDTLTGGVGRDYIDGGSGDDIISGGAGRDFLYGASGNDTFVLADDNEQYDNLYDFKSNADQHDVIDISAFVTEDVDTTNLQNYFSIGNNFIYFDKSGSGDFTPTNIIAKLGDKADLTDSVALKFGDDTASFNANTGEFDRSGIFENNAPDAGTVNLTGTEDNSVIFTEQQLLVGSTDAEGDALSVTNVNYTGDNGSLTEIQAINFNDNTENNITLEPTLQSFDEFSVELSYLSTGEHSGDIDTLLSMSAPNITDNALMIHVNNADGSIGVYVAGNSNYTVFNGINVNDGQVHNIQLTWDSETGDLKLFDNNSLIATENIAQGLQIEAGGKIVLGQDQDSYNGNFDPTQALTNAAITKVTMAYEAVADTAIIDGNSLTDSSTNLAFNIVADNGNIVETTSNANLSVTSEVSVNTGYYEFTPTENFNSNVNIDYQISDGFDTTNTNATLEITAVNDAPVAGADIEATIVEDNSITITEADLLLNATDPDGNVLSVTNLQANGGTINLTHNEADNTWTLNPAANWSGTAILTFDISDSINPNPTPAQMNLTVNPEADAPTLTATGDTVISTLNFENLQLSEGWSVEHYAEIRTLEGYIEGPTHEGSYGLELDAQGAAATGYETPDALYYTVDTSQGHEHKISLWAHERMNTDGSDHIEIVWNGEVIETINPTDSWVEYVIALPDTNEDSTQLEIREVADQNQGSGPLLDLITLTQLGASTSEDPNVDYVFNANEDSRIALDLEATLTDNDGSEVLITTLSGLPLGFSVTDGNHSFISYGADIDVSAWDINNLTITPAENYDSNVTLTLTATATESDGSPATEIKTLLLNIQSINDAPTAISLSSNTISENDTGAVVGELTTVDVDATDSHSYTVSDDRFEVVNNQLKLKDAISLDHETVSSVDVTVTTTDLAGAPHSQLFNVVVQDVNDAPEVSATVEATTVEDNPITLTKVQLLEHVTDQDANTEFTITNVQINGGNVAVVDNGNATWTFTPTANWSGAALVSFDVSDGIATPVSTQLNLTVNPEVDTPTLEATGGTVISTIDFNSHILPSGWSSENNLERGSGYAYEGDAGIELDAGGAPAATDALYYDVDTSQGNDHKISLWIKQRTEGNDGSDHVEIVWNGEVLQTIDPTTTWGVYTVELPNTGADSTELAIREVADQNQGSGPLIDFVNVIRLNSTTNEDPNIDYTIHVNEDGLIAIDITTALTDTDGSENLSVSLTGLPAGFVLTDGANTITSDGNAIDISGWQAKNLTATPLDNYNTDFNISITATATEAASTESITKTILVDMTPVDDVPIIAETPVIEGTENTTIIITKDQLLSSAMDVDGDGLSVENVTYSGSDGSLLAVNNMTFGADTNNKIDVGDKLASFNEFSIEFDYTSTGSHSGSIDSLFSLSTPNQDNELLISIKNTDGSLQVTSGGTALNFSEINMYDGNTHNITFTWDGSNGELKLYDGNELVATEILKPGHNIEADGWFIVGQDQDSYGGGFDSNQSLTNAKIGQITMAYEAVAQATIESGTSVAEASSNLALDLVAENGQIVDKVDDSSISTAGSIEAVEHYEFTPTTDFNGNVDINYTVSDGVSSVPTQLTVEIREHTTGTSAEDTLIGTAENDFIEGMVANDSLDGGAGDDILSGGAGDDILTGGTGSDHFIWHATDVGTAEAPAQDTITDFQTGENGDVIDLADILTSDTNELEQYLDLNFENGNTTIGVKSEAGGEVTQKITLEDVDLSGYGGATNNTEIINNLLNDGNINVDGH